MARMDLRQASKLESGGGILSHRTTYTLIRPYTNIGQIVKFSNVGDKWIGLELAGLPGLGLGSGRIMGAA